MTSELGRSRSSCSLRPVGEGVQAASAIERILSESQAHRLFTEMGAPIRAEQVLRQLERR